MLFFCMKKNRLPLHVSANLSVIGPGGSVGRILYNPARVARMLSQGECSPRVLDLATKISWKCSRGVCFFMQKQHSYEVTLIQFNFSLCKAPYHSNVKSYIDLDQISKVDCSDHRCPHLNLFPAREFGDFHRMSKAQQEMLMNIFQ